MGESPSCSGVPIGTTSERSRRISVSVATSGSTAISSGAAGGTFFRTSASTVRARGLTTGLLVSTPRRCTRLGPPGTSAASAESGALAARAGSCCATTRPAQATATRMPAAATGLRVCVQARHACAVQSVSMATNGSATCVRLFGCERPRKYVSERAPNAVAAVSGTIVEGRARGAPRPRLDDDPDRRERDRIGARHEVAERPVGIGSCPKPLTE